VNVALRLRANAQAKPHDVALYFARRTGGYGRKTYREVDAESDAYARGFLRAKIARGTKTIVMVKPGPELFSILFALFKIGAVPVIVDPGMGMERMLHCYRAVGAEAFIGIPLAHVVRCLNRRVFGALETVVTVGQRFGWGGYTLAELAEPSDVPLPIAEMAPEDLWIINFTTGSTGAAKGVEYTHAMGDAMVCIVASEFQQGPSTVTFATLPLFVILDLLNGSTSVLPPMDPTRPAFVDAERMIRDIDEHRATHMFASPAFLRRVGEFAEQRKLTMPSLRVVVSGGAPVSDAVLACFQKALRPEARLLATYGATEALPIAMIDARTVLAETAEKTHDGAGTCVGSPVREISVRIVRISDEPIPAMTEGVLARTGEVGEIVVSGPVVSRRYHGDERHNASGKIADGDRFWHRTGDLGRFDDVGRLWFAGRKSHRVRTRSAVAYTVQWEGVLNAHPEVSRSAIVGVGGEIVACIEPRRHLGRAERERVKADLLAVTRQRSLDVKAFLFRSSFPVDIRHNAKIDREELSAWASRALGRERWRPRLVNIVPIAGWVFVVVGLIVPFGPVLRALWIIDVFLSVVVHGAQLVVSLRRGRRAGYSTATTVALTFLLGATWWKFLGDGAYVPRETPPCSVS
jgi:acyl-CoA synthetase (AMP-forming)/AMP-acid ligase II